MLAISTGYEQTIIELTIIDPNKNIENVEKIEFKNKYLLPQFCDENGFMSSDIQVIFIKKTLFSVEKVLVLNLLNLDFLSII